MNYDITSISVSQYYDGLEKTNKVYPQDDSESHQRYQHAARSKDSFLESEETLYRIDSRLNDALQMDIQERVRVIESEA